MSEYENKLKFKFIKMPNKLHGLIDGDTVFINKNSSLTEQYSAIAEELGHYETSVEDDITDYSSIINRKEEERARRWSYEKLIPISDLKDCLSSNNEITLCELAERYYVTESIIVKAIEYYKIREML